MYKSFILPQFDYADAYTQSKTPKDLYLESIRIIGAALGILFCCCCSGSVLEVHLGDTLLILAPPTRHSKRAPLCGYTRVTKQKTKQKRLNSAPNIQTRCPKGAEKEYLRILCTFEHLLR